MTSADKAELEEHIRRLELELDELRLMVAALLELAHKDRVDAVGRAKERARVYEAYIAPAWEQTRHMTPVLQKDQGKQLD